nr:Orf05 [Plesiomonas shigelloides]
MKKESGAIASIYLRLPYNLATQPSGQHSTAAVHRPAQTD